ncbi:MAG: hypothetical protein U5K84_03705 [Alkalibacterium sp.]|nr:hypothetical protein [Alkalibacterium sp.]
MDRKESNASQLIVKIAVHILLSYIMPVIGAGFSIALLMDPEMRNYGKWVKTLAIISLVMQALLISGMLLGWLAWGLNPGETLVF